MNKVNYQKILDEKIEEFVKEGRVPALFLHACCAPCSSYTLEYLSQYFNITIYFYNPNIDTKEEYEMRIQELNRLIKEMPLKNEVKLVSGMYLKNFMRLLKEKRTCLKAVPDAIVVMSFVWKKLQGLQRRTEQIILQQLFP